MANYLSAPDYNAGIFYGPTSYSTPSYPAGVYLSLSDWGTYQQQFSAIQAAQNAAVAAIAAAGGTGDQAAAAATKAAAAATQTITASLPTSSQPPTLPGATPPPASTSTHAAASTAQSRSQFTAALDAGLFGGGYCDEFPDDPACWSYCDPYDPTCGQGGGYGGGGSSSTTIIEQGLSATDVNGIVNGALSGLWGVLVTSIDAVIVAVISQIQKAVTALGQALQAAYQILSRLGGFILNLLKTIWDDVVKGLVRALQDIRQLLKDLYDDVIKPALAALQQIRQRLLDIYTRLIRPLILIIQRLRQFLAILKLFHIGFATKLDNALADIQRRITQPLFFLLSYVNTVANWLNLILTAGYLLQRPLWLFSLNAYKGSTINLLTNAMTVPVSAADLSAAQAASAPPTPAQASADTLNYLQNDSGPVADYAGMLDPQFQQWLTLGF
jgi:hypothetical protein